MSDSSLTHRASPQQALPPPPTTMGGCGSLLRDCGLLEGRLRAGLARPCCAGACRPWPVSAGWGRAPVPMLSAGPLASLSVAQSRGGVGTGTCSCPGSSSLLLCPLQAKPAQWAVPGTEAWTGQGQGGLRNLGCPSPWSLCHRLRRGPGALLRVGQDHRTTKERTAGRLRKAHTEMPPDDANSDPGGSAGGPGFIPTASIRNGPRDSW